LVSLQRDRIMGNIRKVLAKLRGKGIDLSVVTVHNIAHCECLRSAVCIQKPKLTSEHRAARLAWVETRMSGDEEKSRKVVIADENTLLVPDASPRVWLLPDEPTPIRETCKHHAGPHVLVFAVLHSQYTACSPSSSRSSSSSSSLHASCLIVIFTVLPVVFPVW